MMMMMLRGGGEGGGQQISTYFDLYRAKCNRLSESTTMENSVPNTRSLWEAKTKSTCLGHFAAPFFVSHLSHWLYRPWEFHLWLLPILRRTLTKVRVGGQTKARAVNFVPFLATAVKL